MPLDIPSLTLEAYGPGRLPILRHLAAGPQRYSAIVRELELSEAEATRNLGRLATSGLVHKTDGAFAITPLGQGALALVPTLDVLARHDAFFRTHTLDGIPPDLVARLGDLAGATFVDQPMRIFGAVAETFSSFERFLDGQCVIGGSDLSPQEAQMQFVLRDTARRHGAQVRGVFPRADLLALERVVPDWPTYADIRTVPRLSAAAMVSDRSAFLLLPGPDGRIDFNAGFHGDDARFRAWCRDLFERTWSEAEPVERTTTPARPASS